MENKVTESPLEILDAAPENIAQDETTSAPVERKRPGPISKAEVAAKDAEIEELKRQLAVQKDIIAEQKATIILQPVDERTALQKKIDSMKEEGMTPITGYFRFIERPGDFQEFVVKKFKGTPKIQYKLYDGVFTTIPKHVGEHINRVGRYPINKRSLDDSGKPCEVVDKWMQRFEFVSSDLQKPQEVDQKIIKSPR
jgi:hypothetical protein